MQLPTIPKEEFFERQRKVQHMMAANDLDLIIAYSDDQAVFGQEHTRWLFNYQPHFEPACTVIPRVGEPIILTGIESEEYIYASSYCTNVKVVDEFVYPDHEFPFANIVNFEKALQQIMGDLDRPVTKIGIASSDKIPYRVYKRIENVVGANKMVGIDELMLGLRAIKTENEIKVIEYAYHIAEKGTEAAIAMIAEGRTEREIAAASETVMRNLGSEGMGIDTIVASGKKHTHPIIARTTFRQIEKNDLILLTIAPRYEGYHGAIGRPIIVGNVEKEVEHAIQTAIHAQNAAKKFLVPGEDGYKADQAARKVAEEAGLGNHFVYSGIHSIGITEFEPPVLKSTFTDKVEENMVFSIDIPLFFNSWGGLRFEDGFHVTKEGPRSLQTLPNELIRV